MQITAVASVVLIVSALVPSPVLAQRFSFERSFAASDVSAVDISTVRGRIDVNASDTDRVVVSGTVTVRVGWDVPVDAIALARKVADAPPIQQMDRTLTLSSPAGEAERRAVTVSYDVRVPRSMDLRTTSDSGATTVRGLSGPLIVKTQSSTIHVSDLAGSVAVSTGSGAVTAAGISGPMTVTTSSSAISASGLASSLRVQTQSGEVDVEFAGAGDVDVRTGSSAIRLRGVRGGVKATTQSGRVTVDGAPGGAWNVTTGSSSVDVRVSERTPFTLDAATRSGSITVDGVHVDGSVAKSAVKGHVHGGGPVMSLNSRSGSIRVQASPR